jgi:tRNA-dihydrouridine synthase A
MKTTATLGPSIASGSDSLDRRVSVAPMMDRTDRHCRYFLRLLSPSALLYTEMITATALLRGDAQRLLAFDTAEHPVALQLGGNEPRELAIAARMGAEHGYDEVNLNCGCPSDRVQNGGFGACLMAEPQRVAECVQAMRESVQIPVTVKCRIAIDPLPTEVSDDYDFLTRFIAIVGAAGCEVFAVHARTAVLAGLSPKENREIPPLRYAVVRRLRQDFPQWQFLLNGGIRTAPDAADHLQDFHGVMIGREAYDNPYLLAELHQRLYAPQESLPSRAEVVTEYASYVSAQLEKGHSLHSLVRHILGLYNGLPGARAWRRFLSTQGQVSQRHEVLLQSLRIVEEAQRRNA